MNILLIGQCTLHWGRMEFGNIGNYYIIEPFIRELHKTFPLCKIKTTMQMSNRFCDEEKIEVLPMEIYYGWQENELQSVKKELSISENYKETGELNKTTPYIDEVLWADLVIDFSGDIWGDNANFLGKDRFLIGLLKDKIAKNLGKKIVMLAGSPGPFSDEKTRNLAKDVYSEFDLVTNREPISTELLKQEGFDISKTQSLACPAFLFEPATGEAVEKLLLREGLNKSSRVKPIVGFILCGWNFSEGPFDKWPRSDGEYIVFAKIVEYVSIQYGVRVCLMSHSNGFAVPPKTFELSHGRDYPIIKQLQDVIRKREIATDVFALDGIYSPSETKAIIGSFDMLVSGRVHAAVAGLSQCVPTVIIDYGHEPKAHKLLGFARVAEVEELVTRPSEFVNIKDKIDCCWNKKVEWKKHLEQHMPVVKQLARKNFNLLKQVISKV